MLENFLNAKPRQPRFMVVKWNHRVEEKLLYLGVRLSLTVRVVSCVQQCAWARHFVTEVLGVFTAIAAPSHPLLLSADSGKKHEKWALTSICSLVFAREKVRSKFWYGSNFHRFNFRPAVGDRK